MVRCRLGVLALSVAGVLAAGGDCKTQAAGPPKAAASDGEPAVEEQALCYESSRASGLLSADARARMAALPLQDLVDKTGGRYTFVKDDGTAGHWGLEAVQARRDIGPKPYSRLVGEDGVYQTERVIFADVGTGATMTMLTVAPYVKDGPGDQLNYFGKANWSADGAKMLWVRDAEAGLWGPRYQQTTDAFGPWLVSGDGSGPRVAFGKDRSFKGPICSPRRPDIAYAWSGGGDVVELNLRTGKVGRTVGHTDRSWHMKLSPDDRYILTAVSAGLWVCEIATGKVWQVELDQKSPGKCWPIHDSYRFLPADPNWVMFWYESGHPGGGLNKQGFHLRNFRTNENRVVPFRFDWNHGDVGRFFGFHCTPSVTEWNGKTFEPMVGLAWPTRTWTDAGPWYSQPYDLGGYAAQWPDDQRWGYACMYIHSEAGRAYLSEVSRIFAKPLPEGGRVNRFRVCYDNLWGGKDRWGEPSVSLTRPNLSPDGTKLLFNSNVFSRDGVYMVVCSLPMAPTDVTAHAAADRVEVSWKPPKYHAEIAGYHVYRSDESGRGYRLITPSPVTGTKFLDAGGAAGRARFYAVRSVEHSGLESSLSAEAAAGTPGDLAVFCEAERAISADLDAPSPDALWVNFEGLASDLYYIWQRRADKPGAVKLAVDIPRAGKYYVVARMKGKDGVAFTIAGQEVSAPASAQWAWARSADAAQLPAGKQTVEIACSKYGSCLDCFFLATDRGFDPAGRILAPRPQPLILKAQAEAGAVRLTWTGQKSPRWGHYNLYASAKAGFQPSQATLIASPDRETHLDWQVEPGTPLHYRVTQVTRDGLESAASNEATATGREREGTSR